MNDNPQTVLALRSMFEDRNLRFPIYPCLAADLNVFRMPDGLGIQFRGGETPVIVRGSEADACLDFLLTTLDGTRTLDDLLEQCPQELSQVTMLRTLSLLHTKGLLVEAESAVGVAASNGRRESDEETTRRQLLFWGRHLDVTRSARTASEVQRRLGTSRLVVVGTGLFGAATYDVLTRSGCADIRVLCWDDDGLLHKTLVDAPVPPTQVTRLPMTSVELATSWLRIWANDADLIISATRNAPSALFHAVNRVSLDLNCRWMRANVDATQIEVGPYVLPYESACYACLELRQASSHDFAVEEHLYQQDLARERPAGEATLIGEALFSATLAASLVAGEATRIVTGIAAPTLLNAVQTLTPMSGTLQVNHILRVPRCPECFRGVVPLPAR